MTLVRGPDRPTDEVMETPWDDLIDEWATALRAARRAEQTIALRTYHLRRLAAWAGPVDPWSLTLRDLQRWTGGHAWANETARSVRSSLRQFWAWGVGTGQTLVNVADGLAVIAPAQPRPKPAPPALVEYALSDPDDRVRLMVRLGNDLGMRRGEVARGHSDDLERTLKGWALHVHGKGKRDRRLPLPDDLARALLALPAGYFFPGGEDGHLSARWVGRLVKRALKDEATMHQLRHLCATQLNDRTGNLRLVQEVLGHASVATTERYVKVEDDAIRDAIASKSAHWSTRRGVA